MVRLRRLGKPPAACGATTPSPKVAVERAVDVHDQRALAIHRAGAEGLRRLTRPSSRPSGTGPGSSARWFAACVARSVRAWRRGRSWRPTTRLKYRDGQRTIAARAATSALVGVATSSSSTSSPPRRRPRGHGRWARWRRRPATSSRWRNPRAACSRSRSVGHGTCLLEELRLGDVAHQEVLQRLLHVAVEHLERRG